MLVPILEAFVPALAAAVAAHGAQRYVQRRHKVREYDQAGPTGRWTTPQPAPAPAPSLYPPGFVPTAFFNLADFGDGKNWRDGATPFWMREPIEHKEPSHRQPPTQGGSGRRPNPIPYGSTPMSGNLVIHQSSPLARPYHPTTTMRMTMGEAQNGYCPAEGCNSYCRIVEIDGGRYYTCSDPKCAKSQEAWNAGNKSYVLVHHPQAWIERKDARKERGHWMRKDLPQPPQVLKGVGYCVQCGKPRWKSTATDGKYWCCNTCGNVEG